MMNEIVRALKYVIAEFCPSVFFGISKVKYPKIDADLRCVSVDGCKYSYLLTLDYWSDNGSYTELNELADKVGNALHNIQGKVEGYLTVFKSGSRFQTQDKDSDKICHITERFEVYHYTGSEEQ